MDFCHRATAAAAPGRASGRAKLLRRQVAESAAGEAGGLRVPGAHRVQVSTADFEAAQRLQIEVAADHELYRCWHVAPAKKRR